MLNLGLGIDKAPDGKHFITMTILDGAVGVQVTVTSEENYEHDLDEIIRSFNHIKADMRQAKSGLVTVQEVPNGYHRQPQGR